MENYFHIRRFFYIFALLNSIDNSTVQSYIEQLPLYQVIIFALLLTTFICQIIYTIYYSKVARYKAPGKLAGTEQAEPVSIVVVVIDNFDYIENGLPLLLEQEYPQFEVIVVNDCGGSDIDMELSRLARTYRNLRFTTIKRDDHFNHSRKIPLNIGIKSARYENIIITDTNSLPTNEKWLASMCRGMANGDLTIGYTGMDITKGVANKFIRCSRFASSVRYLRAAISQKPYKGIYNNIGYTKTLYYANRGYTHLRMAVGEDDLFVQKVAKNCTCNVVVNPRATMRQTYIGGLRWWWHEQRYRTYSFRYYPAVVKVSIFFDLFTRGIFFAGIITIGILAAAGLITDIYLYCAAGGLFIIRELVLLLTIRRIARKLCEIKFLWSFMIYDLISPLTEAALALSRRISPPRTLWVQNSK